MTYTLTPKQGDIVRVHHSKYGDCDAIYQFRFTDSKKHCVLCREYLCVASVVAPKNFGNGLCSVRFKYPLSLMPKPEVRE